MKTPSRCRIAIDIGGTFTDFILIDEKMGSLSHVKLPTSPERFTDSIVDGLQSFLSQGFEPDSITMLVHGTTIVTNSVIERKGAKIGLITTRGFKDVIEVGRQITPVLYDLSYIKPKPLVPRHLRMEVTERINSKGEVLTELNEKEAWTVVRRLKDAEVEAMCVCFLHSYANPIHEKMVKEIISQHYPDISVSLSSETDPEFREYERFSTTILNAYVSPVMDRYLQQFKEELKELDIKSPLYLMQSSGGIISSETVMAKPIQVVESGPAAGVIAAAHLGRLAGYKKIISFDMGGTTAKASLIERGEPRVSTEYEVGGAVHVTYTMQTGTRGGFPIRVPVIDLAEVGAGGGSIAWIDKGGHLKVGPQSAGARPGPVCYGIGGSEPTSTDANVVLGRINPDYFLGGAMKLNLKAAEESIKRKIADELGMETVEAAAGIIRIENSNMIGAIRLVSIERGYDPREFAFFAFGGAGPVHAGSLADEMKMKAVIIPDSPGLASALGLLMTDVKYSLVQTRMLKTQGLDIGLINELYSKLEAQQIQTLREEGLSEITINRYADMRYVGQGYEVRIPIPAGELVEDQIPFIDEAFHAEHNRLYGHCAREEPTEMVNFRVDAIGEIEKPQLSEFEVDDPNPEKALKHERKVFFEEYADYIDCPVYDKSLLSPGNVIEGPAVVEQYDSTIVIYPGYVTELDKFKNLIMRRD